MDTTVKQKRGQVALWVIVAVVIAALFALLFLLRNPTGPSVGDSFDVEQSIETCVRESVLEAESIILPQGGFIAPQNVKMYQNTKVTYLCEHSGYFKPCVHQHPMLLSEMQQEVKNYTMPTIDGCFAALDDELKRRGYTVSMQEMTYAITLGPSVVDVDIQKKITISKRESTQSFEQFSVHVQSPMYDLASLALDIASQEAKYCYFEYVGYMLLYPRWDIRKFTLSDSTRIYSIKDTASDKTMNIAIRGCAIPPGI